MTDFSVDDTDYSFTRAIHTSSNSLLGASYDELYFASPPRPPASHSAHLDDSSETDDGWQGKVSGGDISADRKRRRAAPYPKKKKRSAGDMPIGKIRELMDSNDAVSALNHYCMAKQLEFSFLAGDCNPTGADAWFQYACVVKDVRYSAGEGRNKKMARQSAAKIAMDALLSDVASPSYSYVDKKQELLDDYAGEVEPNDLQISSSNISDETKNYLSQTARNAVTVLHEYAQRMRMPVPQWDEHTNSGVAPGKGSFSCQVILNGVVYPPGSALNKKTAKTEAAILALDQLITSDKFKQFSQVELPKKKVNLPHLALNTCPDEMLSLYQWMAKIVQKMFLDEGSHNAEVLASGKVLAGIVLTSNAEKRGYVLSWATGNRCIKGDHLSMTGGVVNDGHAEVLARRGLVRMLYSEIERYLVSPAETIFDGQLSPNGKLRLKPGTELHLYISTAPCGDARVFSINEPDQYASIASETLVTHVPLMTDPKKQALLRTKIEGGEGTIPTECDSHPVQTIDGIAGGERLRTMSCSDKILKWNVLGVQGTLLTHFIEPIYLSSIIVGNLFHHGHMARSSCCRVSGLDASLPPNSVYRLQHPILAAVQAFSRNVRDISKSTLTSVNWNYQDQTVELINGQDGKLAGYTNKGPSRLCKKELFDKFRSLCDRSGTEMKARSYIEAKQMAKDHTALKHSLSTFCQAKGYGPWLPKPREEKMFH